MIKWNTSEDFIAWLEIGNTAANCNDSTCYVKADLVRKSGARRELVLLKPLSHWYSTIDKRTIGIQDPLTYPYEPFSISQKPS
jgi:hypothetical protein